MPHAPGLFVTGAIALSLTGCRNMPSPALDETLTSSPSAETVVASGNAQVFVLELSLPKGVTLMDAKEADERTAKRAVAALDLEVTEKKIALGLVEEHAWSRHTMTLSEEGYRNLLKRGGRVAPGGLKREVSRGGEGGKTVEYVSYTGTFETPSEGRYEKVGRPRAEAAAYWKSTLDTQRATLAALGPEPRKKKAAPYEVRARWRYVTFDPPPRSLEDAQLQGGASTGAIGACMNEATKRRAVYLRGFGAPGVDPGKFTPAQLAAGVGLPDAVIRIASIVERDPWTVERPTAGRLMLRLEKSCPARVVRVDDTVVVSNGSGIIAVPQREAHSWYELRDATCLKDPTTMREVFGPAPAPIPGNEVRNNPVEFWISQHKAELERLERKQFKLALP